MRAFARQVGLEFSKMRRLRTLPITSALVLAVSSLSSITLFPAGTRATFDDPSAAPWAALLLTYTLFAAMTSPLIAAVLASRQTDIEHTGAGWTLAATAGTPPGRLCRAKAAALALILLPATSVQTLLVVGAGLAAGIRVPLEPGPWAGYTALLFLVNAAFCTLHVWGAAVTENQLAGLGVGVLGSFAAVFCMLMPPGSGRFVPWGYYAVISHAGQVGDAVRFVAPPLPWIAGFLLTAALLFAAATRNLDHRTVHRAQR